MRIARLSLLAFGPFTNGELGFSPKPGVLDMIYGPNEAGKSTTLRALIALLYGIPARTSDGHVHEMNRMRVGASLLDGAGRSLSLVRRKGQKHTLLDAHDQPLPDSALSELLGGLDETMFRQMFGLDHERLREGAEALLSGGGNLGESLFDAGTGARAIRSVLTGLKQEADELFKPRGTTTKLQVAVRTLRDRQRARKEAVLSPQTFVEQRKALSEARSALEEGLRRRRELLREASRLARALSALPLFARRDLLLGERRELGEVRARGVELQSELEPALEREERECARLSEELARVVAVLASLPEPRAGRLELELLRELEQRFGSHRKNLSELPLRRAELVNLTGDVAALRERLGRAVGAVDRLDTPARTRLRALGEDDARLRAALTELEGERATAEREHAARSAELRALGELPDGSALDELVRRTEQDEGLVSLGRREAELAQKRELCGRGLLQLGLTLAPDSLASLALPDGQELELLERAHTALEGALAQKAQRLGELESDQERLARERSLLLAEGDVVTEETLAQARAERGRAFSALLEALRSTGDGAALLAFERAEARADELADRLRREASRASTLLRIEHEERALSEARLRLHNERAALEGQRSELLASGHAKLVGLGLEGEPLGRARTKLKKLEALVERATEAELLARELELVRARADEAREALARALGATPCTLLEALALARTALARDEAARLRRDTLRVRVQAAHERCEELDLRLTRTREGLVRCVHSFTSELERLGFAPELSPVEVLATLEELGALQTKQRAASALAHGLTALEEDDARFTRELAALCQEHAPEAAHRPVAEAMAALVAAHQRGHDAARERERAEASVLGLREQLAARELALRALKEERARLFAAAHVDSFAALRESEQREKRALALDTQIEQLELQLAAAGEGRALDELRAEAQSLDPDEARARLSTIEGELVVVEDEIDQRNQQIGRLSAGLEQLSGASGAVALAEEAESDLADVRTLARRFAELKLGHTLLAREVERYRAAHQGPVLERASALFPRLTLGRYRGLEVELDERDQPVLACLRDTGKSVRVDGLSDGTRDQLYLALRVASIERYLSSNAPMPLVLDDAFVHFDDARAQAALTVLGELCQRTQVLFFTHHARMIELAKKALGKDKVLVHELDPVRGIVRTRDDGPLFARV